MESLNPNISAVKWEGNITHKVLRAHMPYLKHGKQLGNRPFYSRLVFLSFVLLFHMLLLLGTNEGVEGS